MNIFNRVKKEPKEVTRYREFKKREFRRMLQSFPSDDFFLIREAYVQTIISVLDSYHTTQSIDEICDRYFGYLYIPKPLY